MRQFFTIFKPETLLGKSLKTIGVLSIAGLFENGLRFLRNIILARIIAPEDFGLMALITAAVAAMEAMAEVGLVQSVIQNKNGKDERFLNIVWWLSWARGLFLFAIGFFLAPHIANFFGKPESCNLLRVSFSVILLNGMISPWVHVLQKDLKFTQWILLVQGSALLGISTAIVGAFMMPNVWALVIGYLAEAFAKTAGSFIFYPFRPKLSFEKTYFVEITAFSRRMIGLPILMMLFVQADTFIIGKLVSVSALGMYVLAKDLADLHNKILNRINPVFLPVFSMMQDEKEKLANIVLDVCKLFALWGIPLTAFLVGLSSHLLKFIYGSRYEEVSLPFSILSVYTFLSLFSKPMMNAYMAIGRPDYQRNAALVRTLFFLIAIYPLTFAFGLVGSALSALSAVAIALMIQLYYFRRVLKVDFIQFLRRWVPGAKWSILVIIPVIVIRVFDLCNGNFALLLGFLFLLASWTGCLVGLLKGRNYFNLATAKSYGK